MGILANRNLQFFFFKGKCEIRKYYQRYLFFLALNITLNNLIYWSLFHVYLIYLGSTEVNKTTQFTDRSKVKNPASYGGAGAN